MGTATALYRKLGLWAIAPPSGGAANTQSVSAALRALAKRIYY